MENKYGYSSDEHPVCVPPAKLIALYFPQLHTIPENDEWWGEGFTDWINVKSATPKYDGHHQPRIPLNRTYYDQSRVDTIRRQIEIARKYGVYGFCHYHYWFDGKQLLEKPTNIMLDNKDLEMPFCLSWANETWSRRWDGRDHQILIQQRHPPVRERWEAHFNYLIKAWSDERAIKVNGKPVFIIYRPHRIPELEQMLDFWREKAIKNGLEGLYFIVQKQYELPNTECLRGFDAVFQFQPFESIFSPGFDTTSVRNDWWFKMLRSLPEYAQDILRSIQGKLVKELTFHDYDTVWEHLLKERPEPGKVTYPGAFVDWDNTARYKNRATIFKGASPERFQHWFSKLVGAMEHRNLPENFIFLNAWNEWAEGAYLEPDERHGYRYLEAVHSVLRGHERQESCTSPGKLATAK